MIYVATLHTYDYNEFETLVTASTDKAKICELIASRNVKNLPVFWEKNLTESDKDRFQENEIEHYRITEFEDK